LKENLDDFENKFFNEDGQKKSMKANENINSRYLITEENNGVRSNLVFL